MKQVISKQQSSTLARKLRNLARINGSTNVPQGHVPVYVGDKKTRFIVSAELLNHRIFVDLLDKSAEVYGYEQQGALRIPCHALEFERILEAVRSNLALDLEDLIDTSYSFEEEVFRGSP